MTNLSFLDLPGEIRNQIYHQLLIIPPLSAPRRLQRPHIYPAILCVCRKIYEECKQILYGSNTFLAHANLLTGLPRLRTYYATISNSNLISLIRRYHIQVRLDCDPNFQARRATEAFTDAEEFTIEVFQAQFGSSDYKVLKLFEGIRGVKKSRVYGSVQAFPEYAKWLQATMQTPKGMAIQNFNNESIEEGVLID